MSMTAPRPDLEFYESSIRLEFPIVVKELIGFLGGKLVAYIAGVKETRAAREWADGVRNPDTETNKRLRLALRIAGMIASRDGAGVAQAWFQGLNPQLDDRSPARLLREGDPEEVGPEVLAAARAFLVGG